MQLEIMPMVNVSQAKEQRVGLLISLLVSCGLFCESGKTSVIKYTEFQAVKACYELRSPKKEIYQQLRSAVSV